MVVADDTMNHDIIIGREFIDNTKLKLTYSNGKVNLEFNTQNEINIESILPIYSIETKDKYDIVTENLDINLSWHHRQDLLYLLREIDNTKIEPIKDEYFVRVHLKDNSLF